MPKSQPPKAPIRPHKFTMHGHERVDNYHWLRDDSRSDKDVLAYLHAENDYYDSVMSESKTLSEKLYQEIIDRIVQNDASVPYQLGQYWYYSRYTEGKEYPIYARKAGDMNAAEEVLLDVNELAEGHSYYSSNNQSISHNHQIYAFSEDTVSRRQYDLRFKNLTTGEMYPDVIKNTTGAMAWAKDNKTIFYTRKHPVTLLPYQVYRHQLGTPVAEDVLVYEEQDNTFYVSVYTSRSQQYIMLYTGATTLTEMFYLPTDEPEGEFKSVYPRSEKHEYTVEDFKGDWIIVSNKDALNSKVMQAPIGDSADMSQWQTLVPHDDETLIYDVETFKDWLVIEQRRGGLRHLKAMNWHSKETKIIQSDEAAYTMSVAYNPQQNHNKLRYDYDSLTQLSSVLEINLDFDDKKLLKQDKINGAYEPKSYQSERLEVAANDGAKVPVSLVYKKGLGELKDRPLLVYAYGSYGSSIDPAFSLSRLSLLDRGFIYAIAHVRGSQAKGRQWYEDGKMFNKKNTFTDFIEVTEGLLKQGVGDTRRVYAWGGSAGGLLIGAVANMHGMLYHGMIAAVPFVDVVTTMLDEDIPLTTGEFDEWGNPKNKDAYDYMLSYSPYDQVKAQDYPNLLITTGLHDSQVQYWEPAKWAAKLRELKTNDNLVLLRTNMETGHGGASGRFSYFKETAQDYTFLLNLAGIKA
ncbi:S9 family peptidase [Marinicella sp. S1101]|uniref:S9 family peptidase n=1 Tax=Marinicella marina TaxID=2996016 RepID=UPI002260FF9C|nr:S9 family peptidase [Marinicella marina]MCX7552991.1 S9 family peptidase [Marinicella marina]MDJ1139699.1 S9 family peptidase [Marinicella marina]